MTQTKAELLQTRHQGDIRLGDADSSHYVGFKAPATVGTSLVWTLPAADGTANYLLKTDGSGNLGWVADSSTDSTKMPLAGGIFTGDVTYNDGVKARFGTGNDLEIFHNASNSVINDTGTGDLLLQLGGATKFQLASGGVALTGGAAANITALSDGATITIDMATACHHSVTLGGNRTFAAPSNQVVGQAGSIFITQDGSGSRTAAFNAAFKFVGGTAPTLTTGAGLTDRIDYIIKSSNVIHCAVSLDVK